MKTIKITPHKIILNKQQTYYSLPYLLTHPKIKTTPNNFITFNNINYYLKTKI
jgi:hypothetical protein